MNVATKALESVKALLPSVEETTTKIRDAIRTLRRQMAVLKQQRDELLASPLSLADVEALLHAQIDKEADAYRDMAAKELSNALYTSSYGNGGTIHKPKLKGAAVGQLVSDMVAFSGSMLGGIRDVRPTRSFPLDTGSQPFIQTAAAFFFRDEMKRGASQIVAAMKYPFADAASMAQVREKLAALDAELSELSTAHSELEKQARALGIALPGYDDDATGGDVDSAAFDPTGWVPGETDEAGNAFYFYRWPSEEDRGVLFHNSDGVDLGRADKVLRRDERDGTVAVVPHAEVSPWLLPVLGAPKGFQHLPQFSNFRSR